MTTGLNLLQLAQSALTRTLNQEPSRIKRESPDSSIITARESRGFSYLFRHHSHTFPKGKDANINIGVVNVPQALV